MWGGEGTAGAARMSKAKRLSGLGWHREKLDTRVDSISQTDGKQFLRAQMSHVV